MSWEERREFTEQLKAKADIVQYVGEAITLKRSGRGYVGLCPFHREKTASFHVDPIRRMYHCFGCRKGGDIISFAMEIDRLSFPEAIRKVAGRFGIPVPEWRKTSPAEIARQDRLKEVVRALVEAGRFFEQELYAKTADGEAARRYLAGRGLTSEVSRVFGLGYSPRDGRRLESVLAKAGIAADIMQEAGLLRMARNGESYAAFRGRVVFPIRSASGKMLGFGARSLDGSEPKYLNSSDSEVFRKGRNLYGLFEAVRSLRGDSPAVLVEGYLDVVSLRGAGFDRAVAPLGTALTEEQAELLYRYTKRIVVMFDGDSAGHRAALRAMPVVLKAGFEASVAVLPPGDDPDSLVRKEGIEAVERAIGASMEPIRFALQEHARGLDLRKPRFRARVIDKVKPILTSVKNPVLRQSYYQILADEMSLSEQTIAASLTGRQEVPAQRQETKPAKDLPIAERRLLYAFLDDPALYRRLRPAISEEDFGPEGANLLHLVDHLLVDQPLESFGLSIEAHQTEAKHAEIGSPKRCGRRPLARSAGIKNEGGSGWESIDTLEDSEIRSTLHALRKDPLLQTMDGTQAEELVVAMLDRKLKQTRQALLCRIRDAERAGDSAKAMELMKEKEELRRRAEEARKGLRGTGD